MKRLPALLKSFADYARLSPLIFTAVVIAVLAQYSFYSMEVLIYDSLVATDWSAQTHDDIVLITFDEKSDEYLGERYPYSYATHARTLGHLIAEKPVAVGLVSLLPGGKNSDSENFVSILKRYKEQGGIFRLASDPKQISIGELPESVVNLGLSRALVVPDHYGFAKDEVVRRVTLTHAGELSFQYWLANEVLLSKGKSGLTLKEIPGNYYDPTIDGDLALFRYSVDPLPSSNQHIQRIPYHLVANGTFPAKFFEGKIVLIGPSYMANSGDYAYTPFEKQKMITPKLSIIGSMVESLIEGQTIRALPRSISIALAVVMGLILAMAISRANPTRGLIIAAGFLAFTLLMTHILFVFFSLWLPTIHILLTIASAYYIGIPFKAIDEYQRRFEIQEETTLLRKVERLKQNFISLMSHDLKTPVAKIAGIADTMRRQAGDDHEIVKGINSIVESTRELNNFITSILDLTKVESSEVTLQLTSEDLNTLVEQVVSDLRFEIHAAKMKIEKNLAPLYPIQLDSKLMTRVISNLIGNAVKYAGADAEITVTTEDDSEWVYLSIRDNGVGIPEEDINHIFDKFYRVKNDANHSIKGSGLGLYLVKYFIELHGGSIAVQSQVGEGTEFKIKLRNA